MKVRIPKDFGGPSQKDMLSQINKIQEEMASKQEELEAMEYEVSAGGGAVKVTVTGQKRIKDIEVKPEVVDPEDLSMLTDLICAAVNEALEKVEKISDEELGKISGKMNLPNIPGLNL